MIDETARAKIAALELKLELTQVAQDAFEDRLRVLEASCQKHGPLSSYYTENGLATDGPVNFKEGGRATYGPGRKMLSAADHARELSNSNQDATLITHREVRSSVVNVTMDLNLHGRFFWHGTEMFPFQPTFQPTSAPTPAPTPAPTDPCNGIGQSVVRPATNGEHIRLCWGGTSPPDGFYYIKPSGIDTPLSVFVDFSGATSGISTTGGWMRVRYAQDYYSQASPWTGAGTCENSCSIDFSWDLSNEFITAMLADASEIRQTFETGCFNSVGWTYSTPLQKFGAFRQDLLSALYSVATVSYGFSNINSFAAGTDTCDINDNVWRSGTIYMRDTTRTYLPIRQVWAGDINSDGEEMYFPLRTGSKGGDSWVL